MITNDEFQAIKIARNVLTSAFALEEAYDLVVGNYIELEQDVLTASVSEVCRQAQAYNDFFGLRSTINRRFVNLLSACRSYIDQTPQRLKNCTEDPIFAREQFKTCLSGHYDASFSYRFLEALRNHVQHCGLAVHRVSTNSRWVEANNNRHLEVSVEPFANRKFLSTDSRFKKSVLDETPEDIPLLAHLRTYMEAIGNAHQVVRSAVSVSTISARGRIEAHIKAYADINDGVTIGLAAVAIEEHRQEYKETVPLLLEWDDVRLKLEKRNSSLQGLANRVFVSRGS
ncbi:hypothetical protein HNP55_002243 [Paucibacter oligotrophus]|uniref:Uncharacterized protein n=1 Tax=Roseateles oligotrophus TaxID=1769250 RepID=A0A840L6A5_9BURK|nr:hypothetical protein [Roseateles oligotrophus]MBB4843720.1 hypothetical protein [Roseateles oligotrophus]